MAKLIINPGAANAAEFNLDGAVINIGRDPENIICLDDHTVSVRHAIIRRADETYEIEDLHSSNGTTVNGKSVSVAHLEDGDILHFGSIKCGLSLGVLIQPDDLNQTTSTKRRLIDRYGWPAIVLILITIIAFYVVERRKLIQRLKVLELAVLKPPANEPTSDSPVSDTQKLISRERLTQKEAPKTLHAVYNGINGVISDDSQVTIDRIYGDSFTYFDKVVIVEGVIRAYGEYFNEYEGEEEKFFSYRIDSTDNSNVHSLRVYYPRTAEGGINDEVLTSLNKGLRGMFVVSIKRHTKSSNGYKFKNPFNQSMQCELLGFGQSLEQINSARKEKGRQEQFADALKTITAMPILVENRHFMELTAQIATEEAWIERQIDDGFKAGRVLNSSYTRDMVAEAFKVNQFVLEQKKRERNDILRAALLKMFPTLEDVINEKLL